MDYLQLSFRDARLSLPRYVFGDGVRRALIVAGVHGREHSSILVAYRLAERLARANLAGVVEILPVANPRGYAAGTRETPEDGLNLGDTFGCVEARSITQALAHAIRARVTGAELILDLHAAGEARYLPHTIFCRAADADFAAQVGLHFAIRRTATREQKSEGTLLSRLDAQQRGVVLELGGGMTVNPEDVELGLRAVMGILSHQGFLSDPIELLPPTPQGRVYLSDVRQLIRAPSAGAFYPTVALGASVDMEDTLGMWVPFENLEPEKVVAPRDGRVIYHRTRPVVNAGETLAMLMPSQELT